MSLWQKTTGDGVEDNNFLQENSGCRPIQPSAEPAWLHPLHRSLLILLPSPEVAHFVLQVVHLQQIHLGEASQGQVLDLLKVPETGTPPP